MQHEFEQLVARVYRSTTDEVQSLAQTMSQQKRAGFALFCYSRSHLRDQGLTLAEMCDPDELRAAGGSLIAFQLKQQLEQRRASWQSRRGFPQITLASEDLWAQRMAGAEDAELEEVDAGDDLSASLSVHFPDPV